MSIEVEAYVSETDCEAVIEALSESLGTLKLRDHIDPYRFYDFGDLKIVIQSGIQDGFISVWIRGNSPWKSHPEFARFLAKRLNCCARCDPGFEYPQISPYSDQTLEINGTHESIIRWE